MCSCIIARWSSNSVHLRSKRHILWLDLSTAHKHLRQNLLATRSLLAPARVLTINRSSTTMQHVQRWRLRRRSSYLQQPSHVKKNDCEHEFAPARSTRNAHADSLYFPSSFLFFLKQNQTNPSFSNLMDSLISKGLVRLQPSPLHADAFLGILSLSNTIAVCAFTLLLLLDNEGHTSQKCVPFVLGASSHLSDNVISILFFFLSPFACFRKATPSKKILLLLFVRGNEKFISVWLSQLTIFKEPKFALHIVLCLQCFLSLSYAAKPLVLFVHHLSFAYMFFIAFAFTILQSNHLLFHLVPHHGVRHEGSFLHLLPNRTLEFFPCDGHSFLPSTDTPSEILLDLIPFFQLHMSW